MNDCLEVLEGVAHKDKAAFGRLLSLIESQPSRALELLDDAYRASDGGTETCCIGLVGGPGVGKSTLINSLLGRASSQGRNVAVVAIDPSSPFSGGAVLGDRIRMHNHANLPNVFVRSMATRGQEGGLAASTPEIVELLCQLGFDSVLVESAGAGQVDLTIAEVADTVVVGVVPGWGDSIQVAKAGLLEIADIYVVNKSDQAGALGAARDIEVMLRYRQLADHKPKVLTTSGLLDQGIDELWGAITDHQSQLCSSGQRFLRRSRRLASIIRRLALTEVTAVWEEARIAELAEAVMSKQMAVSQAVGQLVNGKRSGIHV